MTPTAVPRPTMGMLERVAFAAVPMAALATVVWLLLHQPLPITGSLAWVPSLGIAWAWRIDGLSALMLLMITGVGSAVFVYAGGYMAGHPGQRRLFGLLTAFLLAMIGCVVADDLFMLFCFWEATGVLSFLLVGFDHERGSARRSAQQALLVTGSGGLAMLAGFIVLAQQCGTSSITAIIEQVHGRAPSGALVAALVLVLIGAFTKSAQFPFHFWLPNAMTAPTPVSAFLHSATMVKLGVYLLGRLDPAFGNWDVWIWSLKTAGSITAAWGMLLALRERDLKRILAWSTVATLGTLVMLVGLRGEGATVAVGALLLAHALYKAPLFFVAGNVDHGSGTRIIDDLGGLRHAMPWTATAAALAGLSMAGIPLSFGFVVKDAIAAAQSSTDAETFVQVSNLVFGAIAVAVAAVAAVRVFWRHPGRNVVPRNAHEGGPALVLPPLVLAALGLVLGIVPVFATGLISEAASAMLPGPQTTTADFVALLALQPLSVFATLGGTLLTGLAIFVFWDELHRRIEGPVDALERIGMAAHYRRLLAALPYLAAGVTRRLQHGRAPAYTTTLLAAAAGTTGLALLVGRDSIAFAVPGMGSLGAVGGALLVVLGAAAAVWIRQRLSMLLAAGLVGYGSAIVFLFGGAPDVALTQFTVETVFVIVMAAVLHAFVGDGRGDGLAERSPRWVAASVSIALAASVVLLLMAATAPTADAALGRFFAEQSVPAAHGRNVVNVILVDFRALDTLGESSVVLLALLAAVPMFAALRGTRPLGVPRDGAPTDARDARGAPAPALPSASLNTSVVLDAAAPLTYALILAVSVVVLLRGHNEPGGGFVGGLLAVTATVVWAFAHGTAAARRRLPLRSARALAACGVALAALSGVPGWWLRDAYLTHLWGPWGLSTVLAFDLGVYLTVWGAVGGYALGLMAAQERRSSAAAAGRARVDPPLHHGAQRACAEAAHARGTAGGSASA